MDFWRSLNGMLRVEITSAQLEHLLSGLNDRGITLYNLEWINDLTCRADILRQDYHLSAKLCTKFGGKIHIRKQTGVFWTGRRMIRRPVLLGGLVLFLVVSMYLPSRVLFVKVEGNSAVPARRILSAAEDCGIRFWASRREVRSEKVKNELLSAVPQLQWAGVNTSGCVATISVKERAEEKQEEKDQTIRSLVASRDGFVLSATAVRGNLLVQPGQTVRKGQILISGYTDCGICIRAESAAGEIMAQTGRRVEAITPVYWDLQEQTGGPMKKYSLLIGKKRINLWKDSGISGVSCDRMYEENYIVLPGGFQLPAALCVDTYISCETHSDELTWQEADQRLSAFAEKYLAKQMIAGQIRQKSGETVLRDDVYYLKAHYICQEMIGMVCPEQIGEYNGKDN